MSLLNSVKFLYFSVQDNDKVTDVKPLLPVADLKIKVCYSNTFRLFFGNFLEAVKIALQFKHYNLKHLKFS